MEEQEYKDQQQRAFNDEMDRRQFHDYKTGIRNFPLSSNVLMMLGNILQPQVQGYDQINMDMAFTFLDNFDLLTVQNASFIITYCEVYGFKRANYLERSSLATFLISHRSLRGKSMELFNKTVAEQKQDFYDHTEKKGAFGRLFTKKKDGDQ